MANIGKNVLANKRRFELISLGIDPVLYRIMVKHLDNKYVCIIKDNRAMVFLKKNEVGVKPKSNYLKAMDIAEELCRMFSVEITAAGNAYNEWVRDKRLYTYMVDNMQECWEYMNVPIISTKDELLKAF